MDSKLKIFSANDSSSLFKLTKKLYTQGFFNCYLSSQQFNLLEVIIQSTDNSVESLSNRKNLQLWEEFMSGNVFLKFVNNKEHEKVNKAGVETEGEPQTIVDGNIDDDIELNLNKGVKSARNLASTIRYLLWEKALDFYYAHKVNNNNTNTNNNNNNTTITTVRSNGNIEDEDDYKLFEDLTDDESNESDGKVAAEKQDNANVENKVIGESNRNEDDDYDDDDDDEDEHEKDEKDQDGESNDSNENKNGILPTNDEIKTIEYKYNSTGELILEVPLKIILAEPKYPMANNEIKTVGETNIAPSILGPSSVIESDFEKKNELKLIKNFNKIYHNFENDQRNFIKRRKLEESDKKLESINKSKKHDSNDKNMYNINNFGSNNDNQENSDGNDHENNVNKLLNFGGAANLSLKNLLNRIDENRDKLHLTDLELRNLILDVRKNRSKWTSDDKIGQEELYEACEKVVLELRGYTEHSTAFLNKVSKREAPNYYQVIKHPMDLNTVMKKLKAFQYKNKQQFVDDLMLIWKNCLTYNSDPNHFLRAHAIAMQKKTLGLIPLIPDITIRDRAEVEKEEQELNKEDDKESNETKKGTGASKSTRGAVSSSTKSSKIPKKGRKRSRDGDDMNETAATETNKVEEEKEESSIATTPLPITPSTTETPNIQTAPAVSSLISAAQLARENSTDTPMADENDEDEEEEENNGNDQVDDDDDDEDLEIQTWKTLTSNTRYKICSKRSALFKDNKLQPNNEALLRDAEQMSNFSNYLGDEDGIIFNTNRIQNFDRNEHNDPYLIEYDVTGGIPSIPFQGKVTNDLEDEAENSLVEKFLKENHDISNLKSSPFLPSKNGLSRNFVENISLMQEIRKICFKISLIKQMQNQSFVHHTQMKAPEIEKIQDIDIDPISILDEPNRDYFNREVCYNSLKRNVSKILMANGFEVTDPFCVDIMTQLAEDYMGNLIKSIKLHAESQSINKQQENKLSNRQILLLSLLENGVEKPDNLYTYIKENILKQTTKLKDLKSKMTSFLKDLLRPGFQESLGENSFTDNSNQYLTGDFASEIGDDFFGFRELGLDKEFGLLSSSIPLHLLHARLHNSFLGEGLTTSKVRYEDIVSLEYPKLTNKDIDKQIGLLKPFYKDLLEKSKSFYSKQRKTEEQNGSDSADKVDKPVLKTDNAVDNEDTIKLVEDEELPNKQRNNRPRIPPTGKIPGLKKKLITSSLFLKRESNIDQHENDENSDKYKNYGNTTNMINGLMLPVNGSTTAH